MEVNGRFEYQDAGVDTVLSGEPSTVGNPRPKIIVRGNNNSIRFGEGVNLGSTKLLIDGDGCSVLIGDRVRIQGNIQVKGMGAVVEIMEGTTFETVNIVALDGRAVRIGEDCMFSYGCEVRSGDGHPVFDLDTKERINGSRDVEIRNHVWVGAHCSILKGVTIEEGCIVGTRSVVSRSLQQAHCAYAGSPARLVRANIKWARK